MYLLNEYVYPLWCGNTVVNETVMFVGKHDAAPLLYKNAELISVMGYDLKTEYQQGIDYEFRDNMITLTTNTRIPFWQTDKYYPSTFDPNCAFECVVSGKPYIVFGEGDTFCNKQIAVTYKHSSKWSCATPIDCSGKFSNFINKIKAKQPVNLVFFGDSISTGANCSSFVGCEPYAESWTNMVTSYLRTKFACKINMVNTSVGGKNTEWGLQNVDNLVNSYVPDLLILGFGMNDATLDPKIYAQQIKQIIATVTQKNNTCQIMLVSPMLANPEVKGFCGNQVNFEPELIQIAQQHQNIGIANITTMHAQILKTKRYFDMTGNNVNHPNDFLSRVYAQDVLQSLLGKI